MAFHQLAAQTRATILMVVALFMFTLMGIFIRLSAAGLPVIEVVFSQWSGGLAVVAAGSPSRMVLPKNATPALVLFAGFSQRGRHVCRLYRLDLNPAWRDDRA